MSVVDQLRIFKATFFEKIRICPSSFKPINVLVVNGTGEYKTGGNTFNSRHGCGSYFGTLALKLKNVIFVTGRHFTSNKGSMLVGPNYMEHLHEITSQ